MKRYFFSGGGSGGHLTPLIAVAEALKIREPDAEIHAILHRGDNLNSVVKENEVFDAVHPIFAGKLRRYHGGGLKSIGLTDMLKNLRDILFVALGFLQSCYLIVRYKPTILFMRGGFVGVPMGFAARLLGKKYVTHDSDAVASLANKLISGGAAAHAVSANPNNYPYDKAKTFETGIPLNKTFKEVTEQDMLVARQKLDIPANSKVVMVTGGGLGAARLNAYAAEALLPLLNKHESLIVFHQAGLSNETQVKQLYKGNQRAVVFGYRKDLGLISAASDIIITRAGATAMAEFAVQHKPMIIVPNPLLTDGHQLHNSKALENQQAAKVVTEGAEASAELKSQVEILLNSKDLRKNLARLAGETIKPGAAERVVDLLLKIQQ